MLRNMVTPEEVDDELEDEVRDECSRYGSVRRVVVHTEEIQGEITVKIFVCFTEHHGEFVVCTPLTVDLHY